MMTLQRIITIVCIGAGCWALQADTIQLKDGYEIKADILKQTDKGLVVDLGFEVISIPQTAVVKIVKDEAAVNPADQPGQPGQPVTPVVSEQARPDWQLYHSGTLPKDTIEKNSERHGEGVVMVTSPGGQGSGFVIDEQGYLITNFHVITGETNLKVTIFNKSKTGFEQKIYKKVKIIALNPLQDLALLKIEDGAPPFKFVYLGDIKDNLAGQEVFAIGNPLGLTRTVSQGIISTPNRNFEGQIYIQTTADINPGNSGGPLFNMRGEVIGVTSSGYIYLSGLNFAIPVDVVKRFIANRDAFAYDESNPNAGYRYMQPPARSNPKTPPAPKFPEL